MNTPTRRTHKGRWICLALVITAGLAGAGAFWWVCDAQSQACDLSRLSRAPGLMPLKEIPTEALDRLAAQENVDAADRLAAMQFGLGGDGLRTRLVRKMVAAQIAQKFSPREIAVFYLNDVCPGAAELQRMAARTQSKPAATPDKEIAYVVNTPALQPIAEPEPASPPEISPLPPEAPPVLVRRAIPVEAPRAVAIETPRAPRTIAEILNDDVPVRRAQAVGASFAQVETPVRRAIPVSSVRLSPQVIYRIAVNDPQR